MNLPNVTDLISNTATVTQFRTALSDLISYLNDQFGSTGLAHVTLDTLGASFSSYANITSSITFNADKSGNIYNFTNTADVIGTLTDISSTLLPGYHIIVKNSSNYLVTIKAANSTNTIDGVDCSTTGIILYPSDSMILFTDNTANKWYTLKLSSIFGTKIGYSKGGTYVQATSRTTAITTASSGTNNALTGKITLFSTTLDANTVQSFTFNNSNISIDDTIIIHLRSGTADKYNVWVDSIANGSCRISLQNITGTITGTESPVLNYTILKGAVA
jgi:hypothetical protein